MEYEYRARTNEPKKLVLPFSEDRASPHCQFCIPSTQRTIALLVLGACKCQMVVSTVYLQWSVLSLIFVEMILVQIAPP